MLSFQNKINAAHIKAEHIKAGSIPLMRIPLTDLPHVWEHSQERIWVVPDAALQWGFDNRHHVYTGHAMVLPAEEQEWRDNQHYRAYVRPTKEEDA